MMEGYKLSEKELRKLVSNIGRKIHREIPEIKDTPEAGRWIQEITQDELNQFLIEKEVEDEKNQAAKAKD